MKKGLLIVSLCLLMVGCRKEREVSPLEEKPLPSYIKNLLLPDTSEHYESGFYVYVSFTNNATSETQQLTFDEQNASMALRYDSSHKGTGLSEQTIMFINTPGGEKLEVSFYYDLSTDTAFVLCCADYLYGDAWNGLAGANIQYCKPVSRDVGSPYYIYRGIDTEDSYFKVTYLGNGFVNGVFHTTWKECCGEESTYDVTGDFSIPLLFRYVVI